MQKNNTGAALQTRRPYPDYSKLLNFRYFYWNETSTDGREPDDFSPGAQIERRFEVNILAFGNMQWGRQEVFR